MSITSFSSGDTIVYRPTVRPSLRLTVPPPFAGFFPCREAPGRAGCKSATPPGWTVCRPQQRRLRQIPVRARPRPLNPARHHHPETVAYLISSQHNIGMLYKIQEQRKLTWPQVYRLVAYFHAMAGQINEDVPYVKRDIFLIIRDCSTTSEEFRQRPKRVGNCPTTAKQKTSAKETGAS